MANPAQLAKLERPLRWVELVLGRHAAGPFALLQASPPVSGQEFERVGHAFCGIVCALLGGALGRHFQIAGGRASAGYADLPQTPRPDWWPSATAGRPGATRNTQEADSSPAIPASDSCPRVVGRLSWGSTRVGVVEPGGEMWMDKPGLIELMIAPLILLERPKGWKRRGLDSLF